MRFLRILRTYVGILGVIFIGAIVTLFVVFPRVVNMLADLLGNMGTPLEAGPAALHGAIALVIDLVLAYFFIWQPVRRLSESLESPGLRVRKGEGTAYIDTESVRQRIVSALSKVADIQQAEVSVGNEAGRALIRLNVVTDVGINGPKKKNEINREVKKVVQDQLGVEVSGQPTINFTLGGREPGASMPAIASSVSEPVSPASTPISVSKPLTPPPPAPKDISEDETVVEAPSRPSGIELARRDALAFGSPSSKREEEQTVESPTPGTVPSGEESTATSGEDQPTLNG